MTIYTQVITTEGSSLTTVKAPALPIAPTDYSRQYQDQFNNVLRLYFDRIDALVGQLRVGFLNTLALPQGAFFQNGVTTLSTNINNSVTTIPVVSTTGFQSAGALLIGAELITYTGKTATSFTGCTRGQYGSSNAAHVSGVYVTEGQVGIGSAALVMTETSSSNGVALDPAD